jgi:hypothetical protein
MGRFKAVLVGLLSALLVLFGLTFHFGRHALPIVFVVAATALVVLLEGKPWQ